MSWSKWFQDARAQCAPGRFLLGVVLLAALASCQTVGMLPATEAGETRTAPVVIEPGPISAADQAEAARLLEVAERSFEARRFFEVLRTTEDLVARFPASAVSGEALRLTALASFEVDSLELADGFAGRYADLLEPGDERAAEMRLLQASAAAGAPTLELDRLLRIDRGASGAHIAIAEPRVRILSDSLEIDELIDVLAGVEPPGVLAPIVEARLSVSLLEWDRAEEAAVFAQRALDGGVVGEERAWAEGVLLGDLPEGRGRTTTFEIGVILPMGGPPALAEFSSLVAEGIEVAVATVLGEEYTVTVVTRDDEGDPELTAAHLAELEASGVTGVVGFLQDDVLVSAGEARVVGLPLVSPTARSASRAGEAVYSLEGADPAAASSVARYAASRAFQKVALVYPETPEANVEADAFQATAEALGMPVVGRFAYEAGVTFFEDQIIAARDALRRAEIAALGLAEEDTLHAELLEPAALFLPIPPEDVEFLAPQVVHYGLDTLAIEILGTSGWTDPQTLEIVDPRHTTGVIATSASGDGMSSAGLLRFQQAYEDYYQRSLVGSTPAIGYDATLLLLEALRPGRIQPEAVRAAFGRIEGIEGATGVFSIVDGRVVRDTEVVRIDDRITIPVAELFPLATESETERSNRDEGR